MPIPDLDTDGFLPPGVHDCTLDEMGARFGVFQGSDRRCRLFERLKSFVAEARSTGFVVAIVVNGSFVTSRPDPNDIDLILVLPDEAVLHDELRPFEYNVVSKRMPRRRFGFDVFLAVEGKPEFFNRVAFFQMIRDEPARQKAC